MSPDAKDIAACFRAVDAAALAAILHWLTTALDESGVAQDGERIRLICEELLCNSVHHAQLQKSQLDVSLRIVLKDDVIEYREYGVLPIDFAALRADYDAPLDEHALRAGGLGLRLIGGLSQGFSYRYERQYHCACFLIEL